MDGWTLGVLRWLLQIFLEWIETQDQVWIRMFSEPLRYEKLKEKPAAWRQEEVPEYVCNCVQMCAVYMPHWDQRFAGLCSSQGYVVLGERKPYVLRHCCNSIEKSMHWYLQCLLVSHAKVSNTLFTQGSGPSINWYLQLFVTHALQAYRN